MTAQAVVLLEHRDVMLIVEKPGTDKTRRTTADYANSHANPVPDEGDALILPPGRCANNSTYIELAS